MRVLLTLVLATMAMWSAQPVGFLTKLTSFDLPGPGGKRFDYLTIAADRHYLISAHLGAGQTYVIDLSTNKVVATVTDTPGAEGVEYIPELKKFYTSNAGDDTIGVVDMTRWKVIKKIRTAASRMEAPTRRRFTSSMCPMSAARLKPSSTCAPTRS